MKKGIITIIWVLILSIVTIGCSNITSNKNSDIDKTKIKDTIDLVLSYEKGYDGIMKKHISEKNFYVCNYIEFYSMYIGEVELQEYNSEIVNLKEEQGRYVVCMMIDMKVVSLETHTHEDGAIHDGVGDEAIGEAIPVEVILKERNNELYIEGFTEYENLEKARELNEGFK